MLTRAQVAKRLGKSIATVRRLEGHALHPMRDERGIHRFDSAEVDELAMQRALPDAARSRWFDGTRPLESYDADRTRRQASDHETSRHLGAAETDWRRAIARQKALATARADGLVLLAGEVCAFIGALSHRQVSQIGVAALERVLSVVAGLERAGLLPPDQLGAGRGSRR